MAGVLLFTPLLALIHYFSFYCTPCHLFLSLLLSVNPLEMLLSPRISVPDCLSSVKRDVWGFCPYFSLSLLFTHLLKSELSRREEQKYQCMHGALHHPHQHTYLNPISPSLSPPLSPLVSFSLSFFLPLSPGPFH